MEKLNVTLERDGNIHQVGQLMIKLGETEYRITPTNENKISINKVNLEGHGDALCITPHVSNVIIIS